MAYKIGKPALGNTQTPYESFENNLASPNEFK